MSGKAEEFEPKGLEDFIDGHRHYLSADIDAIIAACPQGLPVDPLDIQQADPEGEGLIPDLRDRRTELIRRLEAAAAWYIMSRTWDDKPSPSELQKRFSVIESSARKLMEALRLPHDGNPDDIPQALLFPLRKRAEVTGKRTGGFPNHPPIEWNVEGQFFQDFQAASQLRDVVEGVKLLRAWAAEVKAIEVRKVKPGAARHKGDEPMRELFGALVGIWVEVFEQPIATSVAKPGSENEGQPTGPLLRFLRACLGPPAIEISDQAIRERVRTMFLGKGKSDSRKS